MAKGQHKNKINKSQGNMKPPETRYSTNASSAYLNLKKNYLESNLLKMIEAFGAEINKSLK